MWKKVIPSLLLAFVLTACGTMTQQTAKLDSGQSVRTNLFVQEGTFGNNINCWTEKEVPENAKTVVFKACFNSVGETEGAIADAIGAVSAGGSVAYAVGVNREASAAFEQDKTLAKTGINDVIGSVNTINVTSTATAGAAPK